MCYFSSLSCVTDRYVCGDDFVFPHLDYTSVEDFLNGPDIGVMVCYSNMFDLQYILDVTKHKPFLFIVATRA